MWAYKNKPADHWHLIQEKRKKICSYVIAFSDGFRNMGIFKPQRGSIVDETRSQESCMLWLQPRTRIQGTEKCPLKMIQRGKNNKNYWEIPVDALLPDQLRGCTKYG